MATILLSIKPEYAGRIFEHKKLFEFRKRIPQKPVEKVIVYSSDPEQSVIGEFEVLEIIKADPASLWKKTKESAGISYEKYISYFRGYNIAYAYKIGNVTKYEFSKKLSDFGLRQAPQSFAYLEEGE